MSKGGFGQLKALEVVEEKSCRGFRWCRGDESWRSFRWRVAGKNY